MKKSTVVTQSKMKELMEGGDFPLILTRKDPGEPDDSATLDMKLTLRVPPYSSVNVLKKKLDDFIKQKSRDHVSIFKPLN